MKEHSMGIHISPVAVGEVSDNSVAQRLAVKSQLVSPSSQWFQKYFGSLIPVVETPLENQQPGVGGLGFKAVRFFTCAHSSFILWPPVDTYKLK